MFRFYFQYNTKQTLYSKTNQSGNQINWKGEKRFEGVVSMHIHIPTS